MRQLGLNVHRPYRNVCGLDSKSMEVHGLIKDVVVQLVASTDISTIMDIGVVDLPPTYGMLLSISTTLGGTNQMDLSFASIPNPEDRLVRIPREPKLPLHAEKFSAQGNWGARIAQVNHIIDPGIGELDLSGDFG